MATTEIPPAAAVAPQVQPDTSDLPGIKVMLVGPPGSGKTFSLHTLVDEGITPFVVFTENSMGVLSDFAGTRDDCKIHWKYIKPADSDWATMIDVAQKVNTLSNDSLQKMPGIQKQHYNQWIDLLNALFKPKCDRCGKEFPPVDQWGTDMALVMDSLSGLNVMSMNLAVGGKPIKTQPDWGVAMDNEERLIQKLANLNCHHILTAHLDRTFDEVLGGVHLTPSALGKKLGPTIPRWYDDVIFTVKEGATFQWSTAKSGVDLKSRHLPFGDKLNPSFHDIIEVWKKKGGRIHG